MSRIRLERPGSGGDGRDYTVESDRAYRDRLVLKLAGVDDANSAAGLRGLELLVQEDLAPERPGGEHHPEALIGLEVIDLTTGGLVGRVRDVIPTGAADLLVIVADPRASRDEEILVPQVADIVRSVDLEAGRIEILPPEDLLDLNRR
jgi:16S rRNA processing protein RimM